MDVCFVEILTVLISCCSVVFAWYIYAGVKALSVKLSFFFYLVRPCYCITMHILMHNRHAQNVGHCIAFPPFPSVRGPYKRKGLKYAAWRLPARQWVRGRILTKQGGSAVCACQVLQRGQGGVFAASIEKISSESCISANFLFFQLCTARARNELKLTRPVSWVHCPPSICSHGGSPRALLANRDPENGQNRESCDFLHFLTFEEHRATS